MSNLKSNLGLALTAALCWSSLLGTSESASNSSLYPVSASPNNSQWMPENSGLFPKLKADPRQIEMSAGWRWDDHAFKCNLATANIGSEVVLWHKKEIWCFDEMQVGLAGCAWSLFDMQSINFDLVNTDFCGAIPIYARCGDTRYRVRLYHISSHEGNEWIRANGLGVYIKPSFEALDLTAYLPVWEDRLFAYGTIGHILHYNPSYTMDRSYFELGAECFGETSSFRNFPMKAQPYVAVHTRWWEMYGFKPSLNAAFGVAWSDKYSAKHKMTTSLQYFAGHSLEGQFSHDRTHYLSLELAYMP